MKPAEGLLSHADLTELLDYDPATGLFRWKVRASNRVRIGDIAGNKTWHGYWTIYIRGENYLAHRLAWFFTHGQWPDAEIDHIDRTPLNNRIANLRLVSSSQNKMNSRPKKGKRCARKGVYVHREKPLRYRARITVYGVTRHLGVFATEEEAYAAYAEASKHHHGEYGVST